MFKVSFLSQTFQIKMNIKIEFIRLIDNLQAHYFLKIGKKNGNTI